MMFLCYCASIHN